MENEETRQEMHGGSRVLSVWRAATDHARRREAFVLLMPPDVAWANGSLAQLCTAIRSGKRAIFMTYPRVISETIVPDIYFVRDSESERQMVSSADLVERIKARGQTAQHIAKFDEIVSYLRGALRERDLLVTMGAGNVWEIGKDLVG